MVFMVSIGPVLGLALFSSVGVLALVGLVRAVGAHLRRWGEK